MRSGIIRLLGLLTLVGALFSWLGILWPGLAGFLRGESDFLAKLFNPMSVYYDDIPMGGWLWATVMAVSALIVLLSVVLTGRAVLRYLDNSRAPMSVLKTTVSVTFETDDLSVAIVNREQLIHANRPVTAYHMTSAVSSKGAKIDADSLLVSSETTEAGPLSHRILNSGTDQAREIVEVFTAPLPTNWFATYMPNKLVYLLRRLFPRSIVRRTSSIRQFGEYNAEIALIQLTTLTHPTNNATIEIRFPETAAPRLKHVEAFMITENLADPVVIREQLPRPPGLRVYYVTVGSILPQGTLRVTWWNKGLKRRLRKAAKRAARGVSGPGRCRRP